MKNLNSIQVHLPIVIIGIMMLILNVNLGFGQDSTRTVSDIDDNGYKTVKIGNQWWTAENLKVMHHRNGDPIADVTAESAFNKGNIDDFYEYSIDQSKVAIYGRHYSWYVVNDKRGLAPQGYHIPAKEEWKMMMDFIGYFFRCQREDERGWISELEELKYRCYQYEWFHSVAWRLTLLPGWSLHWNW